VEADDAADQFGSRMKERTSILNKKIRIAILAALLLAAILMFAANAGRLLIVEAPERSDVILVLAGETDHRPTRALELLDQGYGRRVVLDVPASVKIFDVSEVQLAAKYGEDHSPSGAVDVCPITGLSTRDESRDAEKCLSREKGNRILIVTSAFHTRRALSIFRHEVRGKSFSVSASHDSEQFGARWWTHRQWAKTCVDEWLRLLWWSAVDRWR
jgi:DUF218 domain